MIKPSILASCNTFIILLLRLDLASDWSLGILFCPLIGQAQTLFCPTSIGWLLSGYTFYKSLNLFFTGYFFSIHKNKIVVSQVGDHLLSRVLCPSARSQASGPRLRSLWPGPGSAGITGPPLFQIGAPILRSDLSQHKSSP